VADTGFLRGRGELIWQNDIGTIGDKIASLIVLFPLIISSLNDPKEGVASHPIHPPWIRPYVPTI